MTHFTLALLFSLFVSVVFGITQRTNPKMMLRFGAFCFTLMIGAVIVGSWVMWAIKH
jgi:flagellar biosynthesis protein FliR